MHNELTNLLPPERQQANAREYYFHLGVVAAALVSMLIVVSALLLLPTYVYLLKSTNAKTERLATIESTLSSENEKELSARLATLTLNAKTLTSLAEAPSPSRIIRSILDVPHASIALTRMVYTPATKKVLGSVLISGTAASRDALRNYQLSLQSAPFARTAALPVSAYAQDTKIPFTITITLAP